MKFFFINIFLIILIFVTTVSAQESDSTIADSNSDFEEIPNYNPSIFTDWRLLNYPLINQGEFSSFHQPNYSSIYAEPSGTKLIASKEEMLAQFRLQQNWEVKKKYGVFAKYLGYAQLIGAASLLGVHIYQWSNLKEMPSSQPQAQPFNKYDFK